MPRLTTLIARGEVCSCLRSKQMFSESPDTEHYRAPGEPDNGLPNGPFWCAISQSLIGADGGLVSPETCRADRDCCEIWSGYDPLDLASDRIDPLGFMWDILRWPEGIQLAVESGAKSILMPSENKRDVADVPDAVLTAIQWQFYDSPTRAALLALGLG